MSLRGSFRSLCFLHVEPGLGFFRLFGVGLSWKDTRVHRLLFSERNGYTRHVMVGHWSIAWVPFRSSRTPRC